MGVNFVVELEMQSVTSSEFLTWCFAKGGCSLNVCQISKIKALFLEVQFVNLKICTCESYKFYLGQNEDCSPRDSTSDSSEKLLQRDTGGRSVCI